AMEDEAPAPVDRSAVAHDEIACRIRQMDGLLFLHDAQLHEKIGKAHLLLLVDDDAERPVLAMRADVDDGAREPLVEHAGHGDQELVVQITRLAGLLFQIVQVHAERLASFTRCWKPGLEPFMVGWKQFCFHPTMKALSRFGRPIHGKMMASAASNVANRDWRNQSRAMKKSATLLFCSLLACSVPVLARASSSQWAEV